VYSIKFDHFMLFCLQNWSYLKSCMWTFVKEYAGLGTSSIHLLFVWYDPGVGFFSNMPKFVTCASLHCIAGVIACLRACWWIDVSCRCLGDADVGSTVHYADNSDDKRAAAWCCRWWTVDPPNVVALWHQVPVKTVSNACIVIVMPPLPPRGSWA